jgi:hypothetical protein
MSGDLPPGTTASHIDDSHFGETPGPHYYSRCLKETCERLLEHLDEKAAGYCRPCFGKDWIDEDIAHNARLTGVDFE